MIYEIGDHRKIINGYMFEADTQGNVHVYSKNLKSLDEIKMNNNMSSENFQDICKNWINNNY